MSSVLDVTFMMVNSMWHRADFTISTDLSRFDLDVVHRYLAGSYWSPGIPRETMERGFRNSLCFGLFEEKRQIGMARVITDRATFAYLADVFVLEEYRGRGLSKWLMECVMAHPDLQGLRRFTLATRDAHTLYEKFGFQALGDPTRHMEINRPDIYEK